MTIQDLQKVEKWQRVRYRPNTNEVAGNLELPVTVLEKPYRNSHNIVVRLDVNYGCHCAGEMFIAQANELLFLR